MRNVGAAVGAGVGDFTALDRMGKGNEYKRKIDRPLNSENRNEAIDSFEKLMPHAEGNAVQSAEQKIEKEYIKNLQQQVYFLELETAYLREQAEKASAADSYLRRALDIEQKYINDTKCLKIELEELKRKLRQKDFSIQNLESDKEVVEKKLQQTEKNSSVGKKNITEENISLKKRVDDQEEDLKYLNDQFKKAKESEKESVMKLSQIVQKNEILKSENDSLRKENKKMAHEMNDLREEMKKVQALKMNSTEDLEEELARKSDMMNKERDSEVFDLKLKIRQNEMQLEQARVMEHKLKKDCKNLLDANNILNQEVAEVNRNFALSKNEAERLKRTNKDLREQVNTVPVDTFEKKQYDLVKRELKSEHERLKEMGESLCTKENDISRLKLENRDLLSENKRVNEKLSNQESEFITLKRDKLLLVDHVAELQEKLKICDKELKILRTVTREMKDAFSDLTSKIEMESNLHKDTLREYKSIMSRNNKMLNSIKSTVYDLGSRFPNNEPENGHESPSPKSQNFDFKDHEYSLKNEPSSPNAIFHHSAPVDPLNEPTVNYAKSARRSDSVTFNESSPKEKQQSYSPLNEGIEQQPQYKSPKGRRSLARARDSFTLNSKSMSSRKKSAKHSPPETIEEMLLSQQSEDTSKPYNDSGTSTKRPAMVNEYTAGLRSRKSHTPTGYSNSMGGDRQGPYFPSSYSTTSEQTLDYALTGGSSLSKGTDKAINEAYESRHQQSQQHYHSYSGNNY
eukprot:Nk52_evm40s2039 gene=Nk52_evmTU40s2039